MKSGTGNEREKSWGADRRNDIGPDSNPCPPWASSPNVVGATACATVPPFCVLFGEDKRVLHGKCVLPWRSVWQLCDERVDQKGIWASICSGRDMCILWYRLKCLLVAMKDFRLIWLYYSDHTLSIL